MDQPEQPRWTGDLVLAVAVAVVLATIIVVSGADSDQTPSPVAYVFAAGFGGVLLARRRLPVTVLLVSVLGTFAYYTLGLPTIGVALPVVAALYSATEQGRIRWAVGAGVVVFAVALGFRLRDDPQPLGYLLGTDAVSNMSLLAAAIALGYAVREHRRRTAAQERITRLTRERAEREAQLRIQAERERISRDLHDTLGHSFTVISVQSGVAAEAVGRDDDAVTTALTHVREQSSRSLTELRSMLRLLRAADEGADDKDADGDARRIRSLGALDPLLAEAAAAGITVSSDISVAPEDLPAAVDTAAFRVVQESVTNILRHSGAGSARLEARVAEGELRVTVCDDGHGSGAGRNDSAGHGIAGMAERVRLLGGSLRAEDGPDGGFVVEARIPVAARIPVEEKP